MSTVERSAGTTASERYLAKLADRSFLNLWSYPNAFIDKMVDGRGKELCDLLVVCGDHVIVFSDKTVEWQADKDIELAWRRWYKKAVEKSVRQIRGAARWITEYPDRIFLDPECKQPLPISLPSPERLKLHGVVVARGAGEANRKFFEGGIGSMMIAPEIQGTSHFKPDSVSPFFVGDVNPDGLFVHVLDDGSLDIVMHELDTIADFAHYLTKKEALIRSGNLKMSSGEEDLVAYYMTHMESDHEHGFPRPDGTPFQPGDEIVIRDVYSDLLANDQYIAKKKADEISYLWDRLIEAFTNNMLQGTTLVPEGEEFDLKLHEKGVRHMALVPRYIRRNFAEGIEDAMKVGRDHDRFTRAFISNAGVPGAETGFFFMTLQVPSYRLEGGYDQYRAGRRSMLETYALSLLRRYPHVERIVGIATEPARRAGEKRRGSSEDLILAEVSEWTEELLSDLQERQKLYGVMKEGNYKERAQSGSEFPNVDQPAAKEPVEPMFAAPTAAPTMNRKQRRALAAKKRKGRNKR